MIDRNKSLNSFEPAVLKSPKSNMRNTVYAYEVDLIDDQKILGSG